MSNSRKLEANWKTIRDEAISQMDRDGKGGFEKETENLRDTGDWQQLTLYAAGDRSADGCQRAPKTCAIVGNMMAAAGCTRGQVRSTDYSHDSLKDIFRPFH